MEGKKSIIKTIKGKLTHNPDSASLDDLELKTAYTEYRTKFKEGKALPEKFKGVFWYYTLANRVPND